jgi:hypothetical protein
VPLIKSFQKPIEVEPAPEPEPDNNISYEFIDNYKTYLVDNSPKIQESFKINDEIITKVFLPFPKINFEWPKHNLKTYHYDFTEKYFGEYWGEDI